MPTPFESEIQNLMRESRGDVFVVAEDLARRWNLKLLSIEEQEDCAQFFVAAGIWPKFFMQMSTLLESGERVPWAQFAEALGRARIKPTQEEVLAIFEGAEAQFATSDLVRSYQLDIWDRRFAENRRRIDQLRAEELERKKNELKEQLQFLKANRLEDEESRVLEEIEAIFPNDPELKPAREALNVRRAREAISRAIPQIDDQDILMLQMKAERLTPEQEKIKTLIVSRAKEMSKKDPALAYDLAMSLHFMDFNHEAYEVLEESNAQGSAVDWLKLELLIQGRKFLTAIEQSQYLEQKYLSEPEAAFAVIYARARALKGLGQISPAIDLLRSLVRIRPGYKSARSLLLDWTGDDE